MTPGELSHAGPMPIQYDLDARIALIERIGNQPRAADPDRVALLAELESIVASHPDHITAREVLVTALADAGEPERVGPCSTNGPRTLAILVTGDFAVAGTSSTTTGPTRPPLPFVPFSTELPQDWLLVPARPRPAQFSAAKKKAARPLLRSAKSAVPLIRFFWDHASTQPSATSTSQPHSRTSPASARALAFLVLARLGTRRLRAADAAQTLRPR